MYFTLCYRHCERQRSNPGESAWVLLDCFADARNDGGVKILVNYLAFYNNTQMKNMAYFDFKNHRFLGEVDDTAYLMSSARNVERINQAIKQLESNKGEIKKPIEE